MRIYCQLRSYSSVFGGLLDLRAAAATAARLAGLEPVLTETHIAQPTAVRDALVRELAACDTYLGLFDQRRGTVPPAGTVDHRAITEEEFRLAREAGLRCLVFLSHAGGAAREPALADFLDREVTDYATGLWTRPYTTAASLRREIVAALAALRPRVVLSLTPPPTPAAAGTATAATQITPPLAAELDLRPLGPAWPGPKRLGPLPADLRLAPGTAGVLAAFRRGDDANGQLDLATLRVAGAALAATLPPPLTAALSHALALAAAGGALLVLEIRTADPAALALPWELLSLPDHPLPVHQGLLEIVRRVALPGGPADPAADTAAALPADHLTVLGFTAAPFDDQAAGAGLGALGLTADSDLFWEREQERLLLALEEPLRERRSRLILPDTGEGEELRQQLAQPERPQLVHIACHGGIHATPGEPPQPVLYLENAAGHRAPLGARQLLAWTRATPAAAQIQLVVLAACTTAGAPPTAGHPGAGATGPPIGAAFRAPATGAAAAQAQGAPAPPAPPPTQPPPAAPEGFAEALVLGGLPRVLAMQGTISDGGATAFAEGFYRTLGAGTDLPAALRAGRAHLVAHGRPHEWAVPVLLASRATGPLVAPAGTAAPAPTPIDLARQAFAIGGVTYLDQGYVGRRDAERRLHQACARGERLLVLHGLGGIGKSTLAARFLERSQALGARVLVIAAGRTLTAAILAEEVAVHLAVLRPVGLAPDAAEQNFRQALRHALTAHTPTYLLLDNLEDNQDDQGRLRDPALAAAVTDLTILGGPGFHILITSRHALELPPGPCTPWNLDLGELSPSGCRKLRLLDAEGLGSLDEPAWQQALHHLGGHPKALQLLGGYLRERPHRARQLLAQMGPAVEAVTARLAATQQARGRSLLLDAVLDAVPAQHLPAFDRLCLLTQPLPTAEIEALLEAEALAHPATDLDWLRTHGLLARTVAPSALEGGDTVHRLLASRRQDELAAREGPAAARGWHLRVAQHLENRPGTLADFAPAAHHRDAAGDREGALQSYSRWALGLRDRHAYRACIQVARQGLALFPAGQGETERAAAAHLWLRVHDGLEPLGAIPEARAAIATALDLTAGATGSTALFAAASAHLRRGRDLSRAGVLQDAQAALELAAAAFGEGGHQRDRAIARGEIADVLQARGQLDEALRIRREEQLPVYEALGDVRSRAVTLGKIADVLQDRGQLDEALRIRREEELPVYEALGDVRERAVTLGKIADVLQARGQLDEALRIRREEELPVFEALGDVRARAVTLGKIADVLQARGQLDEALRIRREEQLPVFDALGDVWARAVTLGKIADVLQARGQLDEALRIRREEQLPVFDALGDVRSRAITLGDIADVLQARGQLDEALRIRREEELPVYEALGDVRSRAVTLGQIADVLQARGQLDEALRIHREEQLPVYETLGDIRSRAITLGKIATVLQDRGQRDEALRIRREEQLPVFEALGDVRGLLVARTNLALGLQSRSQAGDLAEAHDLLTLALAAADSLQIPEAETIRALLATMEPGD